MKTLIKGLGIMSLLVLTVISQKTMAEGGLWSEPQMSVGPVRLLQGGVIYTSPNGNHEKFYFMRPDGLEVAIILSEADPCAAALTNAQNGELAQNGGVKVNATVVGLGTQTFPVNSTAVRIVTFEDSSPVSECTITPIK